MADDKSCEGKRRSIDKPSMTKLPPNVGPSIKRRQKSVGTIAVDIECADALKGLKSIQREAKKATAALKELEEQKNDKYLVIELDELGAVPKVLYKGVEITMKEFVNFQWATRTDACGSTDLIVDYYSKPNRKNVMAERKSIRDGVIS